MQINDVKRNRLAELYGDLKSNLYLAVVDISQYEQTITHLAYFRDLFRKMQPEHKYIIHLFNIVVIISIDDETLNIGRDLGKLNEFFMKYNIYSGVSSAFQNLEELKKRHREAIVALNYGLESSRSQRCFCYENYRVRHLLYSSGNYVDTPENPIVRSMLLYDRENRTRYLELLYSYLLNGQDVPTVCDALDMNPNEVQKKLKTMQELFEIDWKSEDMLNVLSSIKTVQHDDCDE